MGKNTAGVRTLAEAGCGRLRVLRVLGCESQCTRLRELGLCEAAEVTKLSDGSALLCVVCGVRLALGRDLGAGILVEQIA